MVPKEGLENQPQPSLGEHGRPLRGGAGGPGGRGLCSLEPVQPGQGGRRGRQVVWHARWEGAWGTSQRAQDTWASS